MMTTTPISKRISRTAIVLGAGVLGLGTVGAAVAVTTPGDAAESSVASHVHAELTGDPDLQPGDEGFGLAIAQPDPVDGSAVAEAASQGRSTTPDNEDGAPAGEDGEDSSDEAEAERSASAQEVLEGLTEDGELMPGDEGFGQAVADHARSRGEEADEADTTTDDGPPEDVPASDQADDRADEATDDADGPPEDVPASDQADDRADEGAGNADVADDYRPTDPPADAGPPDNPGN